MRSGGTRRLLGRFGGLLPGPRPGHHKSTPTATKASTLPVDIVAARDDRLADLRRVKGRVTYRVSALSAVPAYSSAARQQYQAATER